MSRIRALGAFAYDFVIGDDWSVAVGVVVGLAITYSLAHASRISAWWIIPVVLAMILPLSLWRAVRKR